MYGIDEVQQAYDYALKKMRDEVGEYDERWLQDQLQEEIFLLVHKIDRATDLWIKYMKYDRYTIRIPPTDKK